MSVWMKSYKAKDRCIKGFTQDERALHRAYYDYRQVLRQQTPMSRQDFHSLRVMIGDFEDTHKSKCAFKSREYRRLIRLFKQGKVEEIKLMVVAKKLEML